MAKIRKATNTSRLRVNYAEAQRVRLLLLSEDVEKLNKRDVQTLLKILEDVYPTRKRKSLRDWRPFLIGVGIGIILILMLTIIF